VNPVGANIRVVVVNGRSLRAPGMMKGLSELSGVKLECLEHDFERSWFRPQPSDILIFEIAALPDIQEFIRTMKAYRASSPEFLGIVVSSLKSLRADDFLKDFPNTQLVPTSSAQPGLDPEVARIIQHQVFFGNSKEETEKSPFKTVRTIEERAKLLRDALHSSALASIAPEGLKVVLNCHMDGVDSANGALLFKILPGSEAALKKLEGVPPTKTVVTLSLKQSRVFFRSPTFRFVSPQIVAVEPPSEFQIVQRRSDFRWPLPPQSYPITARFGGHAFKSMLVDVSMGGLALECAAGELEALKKAGTLRDAEFELEGNLIKITELELRHSALLKKGSGNEVYRLGYQFKEVPASSRRLLAEFLGSRSLAYFENYLVAKAS